MSETRKAVFSFTKLFVSNLDQMEAYYQEVFGLNSLHRVQGERIAGDLIEEIMMGPGQQLSPESLVLIKYVERPSPHCGESIIGFTTTDLEGLVARAMRAGGSVLDPIRAVPDFGIKVAFVQDPEGHLAEVVQMLG